MTPHLSTGHERHQDCQQTRSEERPRSCENADERGVGRDVVDERDGQTQGAGGKGHHRLVEVAACGVVGLLQPLALRCHDRRLFRNHNSVILPPACDNRAAPRPGCQRRQYSGFTFSLPCRPDHAGSDRRPGCDQAAPGYSSPDIAPVRPACRPRATRNRSPIVVAIASSSSGKRWP
jgi:hypothetical protein